MSITRKRVALPVGVVAMTAFGLVSVAGAASAAPANIDEDREGSITLQKFEQPSPANTDPVDGTEQDTTGLTPIEGVTFTLQRVEGIDLTQHDDWEGLDEMTVPEAEALGLGESVELVTDAEGRLVFDGLELGLYVVTETDAPAHVTSRSQPFLVSVPLPGVEVGDWIYDVYAYPKNSVGSADKEVDDSAAMGLGDEVTWTLGGAIPAMPEGETLSRYVISDTLDERLEYVDGSAEVTAVGPDGQTALALADGDYTVEYADGTLNVTFTEQGLQTLSANGGGDARVILNFATEVVALGDGTIVNDAFFGIGDAEFEPNAQTEWGAVELYKHADGDDSEALTGAVFQVYASQADAEARENPIEVLDGETLVTDFVTGEDGRVVIPGLKAGTYYIAETQAPAGYIASEEIFEVTVTAGSVEEASTMSIANVQRDSVDLPPLGATGMAAATLIGVALIGGGTAFAVASRRRQGQKA